MVVENTVRFCAGPVTGVLRSSGVGRRVTDTVVKQMPTRKNPCVFDMWVSLQLQHACRYVSFRNTTFLHKPLVLTKDRFFAWPTPPVIAPKCRCTIRTHFVSRNANTQNEECSSTQRPECEAACNQSTKLTLPRSPTYQ